MEHQYPAPIGGDEHMLAELMLPDGAHARSQDWTMFFLHKDQSEEEQAEKDKLEQEKATRNQADGGVQSDDEEYEENGDANGAAADEDLRSVEGPPLVYVLNLVVTKQDTTARR